MQTRRGRTRHLAQGRVHQIGGTRQPGGAEGGGLHAHPLHLVGGDAAQHGGGALTGGGHDDQVAQALQQVVDESARILPGLDDPVDRREQRGGVAVADRLHHLVEQGGVRVAEQRDRALVVDPVALRSGDQLIEQRQRVAHRPAAGAHHERQYARLDLDTLGAAQLLYIIEHLRGRHQPERVVVGAAANRADHLVGLGGGEDELHVLGRLFDDLEQRVEALRRHHVRLVEDEDLEAVARGGEGGALAQVARVIHAVVRGGVDLDDVERAGAVAAELHARRAHAARGVGGALGAVQAAGQDARAGRLAAAARAAEQVCVIHPIGAQRRAQRIGHLRLTDELGKGLGPVAAIQGGNHSPSVVGTTATGRAQRGSASDRRVG